MQNESHFNTLTEPNRNAGWIATNKCACCLLSQFIVLNFPSSFFPFSVGFPWISWMLPDHLNGKCIVGINLNVKKIESLVNFVSAWMIHVKSAQLLVWREPRIDFRGRMKVMTFRRFSSSSTSQSYYVTRKFPSINDRTSDFATKHHAALSSLGCRKFGSSFCTDTSS